jgi:hypothetical protein
MPITLNLPQKDDEEIGHAPRPHSFFQPGHINENPLFYTVLEPKQRVTAGGWERRNLTFSNEAIQGVYRFNRMRQIIPHFTSHNNE